MLVQELLKQALEVRPGDHLVALYNDENEIAGYITTYIHSALTRNERCIYITGDVNTSQVLQQVKKLSIEGSESGDLVILDKSETYSANGKFCPDRLISMIQGLVEDTIADGYSALAITGETSWVLDYEDGEDLIIEYEWKLNEQIFDSYPVSALCRYNINKFSYEMVKNVIQLHPIIIWQNRIHENPYYIPPEGFKNNEIAKYQVDVWLNNIFRFSDTKNRFKTIVEKNKEEMHQLHKNMTNGIIMAFLKLLETHDLYTKDHCSNVASLALRLAESLDTSKEFNAKLFYAAYVHDIGKTLIPREILNKPTLLTVEEFAYIKMHPVYGANALDQMDPLQEIAMAVRHHHEQFNGNGYPDGLSGNQIPLMSRIIAICDSYDAMIHDRPYRSAMSHQDALHEILTCSGKQFDTHLVKHFLGLFPN